MSGSSNFGFRAVSGSLAFFGVAGLGVSGVVPGLGVQAAQAQYWWNEPAPGYHRSRTSAGKARGASRNVARVVARSPKPSAEEVAASKAAPTGPLMAVVALGSQRMTVYDSAGNVVLRSPISSGTAGHRTPTGIFSVIQKNRHHVSNIYSGAPMPYMQRITWSGIAMHAGALPGYPASHGCIRLPYPVAAKMFAISKMGMRVIVAPHEPSPGVFSHPELPEPLMVAAPAPREQRADKSDAAPVRVAAVDGVPESAQVASRFLNPMQNAALEKTKARTRVIEATKANKELLEASLRASGEANAAAAALRSANAQIELAQTRVSGASEETRANLIAQLADAEHNLKLAASIDAEKSKAAYAAASSSRDAEEAQAAAEAAVKVADRGTEPIAVFISRKEGKVFVRQGMVPLFDAPVTFKEPGRPLGTHLFQAMAADTSTGRIGWQVVTVPENTSIGDSLENRGPVRRGERVAPQSSGLPSDARGALERVEMPEDVKKRISERLWVNGSIVISDHGLGNETGKGTDFIVLTR